MTDITIGIDISKDTLDAFSHPDGKRRCFANTPVGHKGLITWSGGAQGDIARIVFEPTGPYHRALERALTKAGLPVVKVNPRQVCYVASWAFCCGHRTASQDRPP